MSKRDLFILIIKIFGLYCSIITLFTILPNNLQYISFSNDPNLLIYVFTVSIATIILFTLLIFNASWFVKFLKLDQGFDSDTIELGKLNKKEILNVSCIVIGGFIFLEGLPYFISDTLRVFQAEEHEFAMGIGEQFLWLNNLIKIAIGYLLITNKQRVTAFLLKSDKDDVAPIQNS